MYDFARLAHVEFERTARPSLAVTSVLICHCEAAQACWVVTRLYLAMIQA